jgi:hypothetical protein
MRLQRNITANCALSFVHAKALVAFYTFPSKIFSIFSETSVLHLQQVFAMHTRATTTKLEGGIEALVLHLRVSFSLTSGKK